MREIQYSRAFFALAELKKSKTPAGHNRYHNGGYQLPVLS